MISVGGRRREERVGGFKWDVAAGNHSPSNHGDGHGWRPCFRLPSGEEGERGRREEGGWGENELGLNSNCLVQSFDVWLTSVST